MLAEFSPTAKCQSGLRNRIAGSLTDECVGTGAGQRHLLVVLWRLDSALFPCDSLLWASFPVVLT